MTPSACMRPIPPPQLAAGTILSEVQHKTRRGKGMAELDREVSVLTEKVRALEANMAKLDARLDDIDEHLETILAKLNAVGGAWRLLIGLAAFAATLGGLLVAVLAWLWPRP